MNIKRQVNLLAAVIIPVILLIGVITPINAQLNRTSWANPQLLPLKQFFAQKKLSQSNWPVLKFVEKGDLPKPYDHLLTQTLMTAGLAHYYRRTPKVRTPLYVVENKSQKTYSRAIIMVVDKNAQRDDARKADQLGEAKIVELGLITMNFSALPPAVIEGVRHTKTPFGALLKKNNVKAVDTKRYFFTVICGPTLANTVGCTRGETLYGRTNTLVNQQGEWIAHVNEILARH